MDLPPPFNGIFTLSWWRGMKVPLDLRPQPMVVLLPVGFPKPDRSSGQ